MSTIPRSKWGYLFGRVHVRPFEVGKENQKGDRWHFEGSPTSTHLGVKEGVWTNASQLPGPPPKPGKWSVERPPVFVGGAICQPLRGCWCLSLFAFLSLKSMAQLFSDPGKKGNPFWGRPFFCGAATRKKKKGGKGCH